MNKIVVLDEATRYSSSLWHIALSIEQKSYSPNSNVAYKFNYKTVIPADSKHWMYIRQNMCYRINVFSLRSVICQISEIAVMVKELNDKGPFIHGTKTEIISHSFWLSESRSNPVVHYFFHRFTECRCRKRLSILISSLVDLYPVHFFVDIIYSRRMREVTWMYF